MCNLSLVHEFVVVHILEYLDNISCILLEVRVDSSWL